MHDESLGSTGPAAHAWVHDEIARSYEQSRATGFVTFGTQLGGVKLVLGGSGRFTESHLASVRKMVLYADTIVIPDPILPWVESARLRKKGTELFSCLGGGRGSRPAELPRQGRVVVPSWPHHVIQRGQLTGGERFMHAVAKRVGRRIGFRARGRPRKGQKYICPVSFRTPLRPRLT